MVALKMSLTVVEVLLLAAALGIPMYGVWIRVRKGARADRALRWSAS
jgi:hypothetical protein